MSDTLKHHRESDDHGTHGHQAKYNAEHIFH